MLDPSMSPSASEGFGGSNKTADIFADNSGRDVANATKILPINNLPSPVIDAKTSPYFAK